MKKTKRIKTGKRKSGAYLTDMWEVCENIAIGFSCQVSGKKKPKDPLLMLRHYEIRLLY